MAGWTKRAPRVQERFNSVYAPGELEPWVEKVAEPSGRARQVHAVFDSCARNYAVIGAEGLSSLVRDALVPVSGKA